MTPTAELSCQGLNRPKPKQSVGREFRAVYRAGIQNMRANANDRLRDMCRLPRRAHERVYQFQRLALTRSISRVGQRCPSTPDVAVRSLSAIAVFAKPHN